MKKKTNVPLGGQGRTYARIARAAAAAALVAAVSNGSSALAQDGVDSGAPVEPDGTGRPEALQQAVDEATPMPAAPSAYSLSVGADRSSHFISYGLDIWGAGSSPSPFNSNATTFVYGTLSATLADDLSAFVNVWTDNNDNVESAIGGDIQEVDVNVGLNYTLGDKLTVGAVIGQWMYAGDIEGIADLIVAFDDTGLIAPDFALNPSIITHYRFDPNGGQEDDALAFVFGVAPSFDFASDTKYPITLAVPTNVAVFTDGFQGGDSGFGYASIGAAASVPLPLPARYGAWTASLSGTYYYTDDNAIPSNPVDDFVVTAFSLNLSF